MLHLYVGPDDFRMREAYRALLASLDGDGMIETNTTTLPARSLRPQELLQHAATVPFLAQARVVVVEGLLASLGGGKAVVREWQPLLDFIPQLPPTNHLVLLEPVPRREQATTVSRSALARALRAMDDADVQEFRELRSYGQQGNEVAGWLRERAREQAVEIEPQALEELVELVGPNLWALSSEVEKLGRYASGRAVTVEDVRLLTPQAREANIFGIVDAVVEGRAAPALLLISRILVEGTDSASHIQIMIGRQLRHLVRATELLEGRADEAAVAEATGLARGKFPLRKLMGQARSSSRHAAEAALREAEASDHAVKTGRLDETLALELLVTRLAEIARRGRVATAR